MIKFTASAFVLAFFSLFPVFSQTVNVDFQDTLCLSQELVIENESTGFSSFSWDFCVGDLAVIPAASELLADNALNRPFTLEVVESDNQWYGFVPSRNGNVLLRLDFGNSPENNPTITNLGALGVNLDGPVGISLIQDFDEWHAFVVTLDNSSLFRLDFGMSLNSIPTATDLGNLGSLSNPDGIVIVRDGNAFKGLALGGSGITLIDFGSDITSIPTTSNFTVSGSSRLWDISLAQDNGIWIGLLSSFGNGNLFRLNFGTTLNDTPVIDQLSPGFPFRFTC